MKDVLKETLKNFTVNTLYPEAFQRQHLYIMNTCKPHFLNTETWVRKLKSMNELLHFLDPTNYECMFNDSYMITQ